VLKALSWVGLVWDLHAPPAHVRDSNRLAKVPATAVLPEVLPTAPLVAPSVSPP
jgi:hypothetical protein